MEVGLKPNSISVVVPAYNSALFIEHSIKKLADFLSTTGLSWEIIAVNDGSLDNTSSILDDLSNRIESLTVIGRAQRRGKGFSVKEGVMRARGDYIFFIDADLPYDLYAMTDMIKFLSDGYDVALVSRALQESSTKNKAALPRRIASRIFRVVVKAFTKLEIKDTQAGLKGFRRAAAYKIFPLLITDGFAFDIEVLLLAHNMGLKIKEVPAVLDEKGISSISLVKESFRMIYDLCKIVLRHKGSKHGMEN